MAANEPVRERIRRKLEKAREKLDEDFERVEFWTAALDAFAQPVPTYEPSGEFLLQPRSGGRDDAAKPRAHALPRR